LTSKRVPLNPWVNNDFPKSNYPCTLYTISDAPGNICFDLFGFGSMTRNPVRNQGSCRRMGVSFVFQILKIIEVDAEKIWPQTTAGDSGYAVGAPKSNAVLGISWGHSHPLKSINQN
jgi:hypothetical protein